MATVSLEALAMAGLDYLEFAVDAEQWEHDMAQAPPHLLVEEEEQGVVDVRRDDKHALRNYRPYLPVRSHRAKDDDDEDNRVAGTCQSNVGLGLGGIIDQSIEKCLRSVRLVVRGIIRLLMIIGMDVCRRDS
jgi:hypothetical protein